MLKSVRIRLFSLVPVAKPEKKAFQINEAFTMGQLKRILRGGRKWDVSGKMDGIRCQIHKSGGRVVLLSDEGGVIPDGRLGPLLSELKGHLPTRAILDGELMYFKDGVNQGHQGITSYLRRKAFTKTDVLGIRYYAFDCLYYNGDTIASSPLFARLARLARIPEGRYLKKVKRTTAGFEELEEAIKEVRSPEGAMIRPVDSSYWETNLMFKFKASWDFDAKVVEVIRTKNGSDVYVCADDKGNIVGRTYAQSYLKAKVGDVIRVTVTEVSKTVDKGKTLYHWYNPRVLREKQGKPGKPGRMVGKKEGDRRVDGQILLERIYQATRGLAKGKKNAGS